MDMREIQDGETTDQLIAAAAAHEYAVTRRQLAEWHRKGLLPGPRQVFGQRVGSVSLYPAGTISQLLALCAFRRQSRRDTDVAWALWWAGYSVQERWVRVPLARAAAMWRTDVDRLRQLVAAATSEHEEAGADDVLSEAFLDFLDHTATARGTRKALTQARKRVGRDRFPTLVRVFVEVVTGAFTGYHMDPVTGATDEERALVEAGLGLTRAQTDRLADSGPWLTRDTEEALIALSTLLRQYPPGYALDAASLADLARARDEAQLFTDLVAGWAGSAEQLFGRGAFGLAGFRVFSADQRPADQAMVVLLWRTLRMAELGSAIEGFLALAQQWRQVIQPTMAALAQLRSAVPDTSELLSPKQIGRGMRSKREEAGRLAALRAARTEHAEELDAFFAQRPELQTMDAGSGEQDSETNTSGRPHERETSAQRSTSASKPAKPARRKDGVQ